MTAAAPIGDGQDDRIRQLALLLRVGGSSGENRATATWVAPTLALTAGHIVDTSSKEYAGTLSVEAPDLGRKVAASLAAYDEVLDVAVLALSEQLPDPVVAFNEEPSRPGQSWTSAFWDRSGHLQPVMGHLEGSVQKDGRLYLKLVPSPRVSDFGGSSGAPVLMDGKIAGIIAGTTTDASTVLAIAVQTMADSRNEALRSVFRSGGAVSSSIATGDAVTEGTGGDLLSRLGSEAREALAWADGMREARREERLHMEDFVAGLSTDDKGPLRRLMTAAGIAPSELHRIMSDAAKVQLPEEGTYAPSRLATMPPYSDHVKDALASASYVAEATRSERIESVHLAYGVLSVSACTLVSRLVQRGLRRETLGLRLPPRNEIAVLRADTVAGDDMLGLGREVNALAAVLAAKDVSPPLSVGLFGDWGSGKSFFMKELEKAIKACSAMAKKDADSPFCEEVEQLWFNAWHYMDSDLWASLASEIFEGLAERLEAKFDEQARAGGVPPARERLLAAAANMRDVLAEAEQRRKAAEEELRASEVRFASLAATEAQVEAGLGRQAVMREALKIAVARPEVSEPLQRAASSLGLTAATAAATDVKAQILELAGALGYLRAVFLSLRHGGRRMWLLALTATVVLVAVVPKLYQLAQAWDLPARMTSVTAALTALGYFLAPFLKRVRQAMVIVKEVRVQNGAVIKKAQEDREKNAKAERERHTRRLEDAQLGVEQAQKELGQVQQQLQDMRADRRVAEFIRERYKSSDYTRHFGTIARARGDFERLSQLLTQARTETAQGNGPALVDMPRIDRIVLYIDDLDRCPEDKVVAVLQAVHLLLAMPLFVVVVGVDSRWLLHSLRRQTGIFLEEEERKEPAIPSEERVHWQSTPLNYLEKIFQIPFTLRPMESEGYRALIDDLAQQPAEQKERPVNIPTDPGTTPAVSPPQDPVAEPRPLAGPAPPAAPPPSPPAPPAVAPPTPHVVRAQFLQIQEWEREVMKRLFPLIPSPRATKRFVNVYRLLRATVAEDDYDEFVRKDGGHYQVALLLLAMLTGHATPTAEIIRDLLRTNANEEWWQFLQRYEARAKGLASLEDSDFGERMDTERWRNLWKDLEAIRPAFQDVGSQDRFRRWARQVARYSFQSGRVLLDEGVEAALLGRAARASKASARPGLPTKNRAGRAEVEPQKR